MVKTLVGVRGEHTPSLFCEDTGKDNLAAGGQMSRQGWRKTHQWSRQDIGHDQIKRSSAGKHRIMRFVKAHDAEVI